MPDRLTPTQRSYNMSRIRGKDTTPEMLVRKYLWRHGFRYRLHCRNLPGRPDIVLAKYRTCIFINGCFWHGHEGCRYFVMPKTRVEFWQTKIQRNWIRDKEVIHKLAEMGWHCITVWECQLKAAVREENLRSILFALNDIFFKDRQLIDYGLLEDSEYNMVAE